MIDKVLQFLSAHPIPLLAASAVLLVGGVAYAIWSMRLRRTSYGPRARGATLPPVIVASRHHDSRHSKLDIRPSSRANATVVMPRRDDAVQYLPGHLEVEVGSNMGEAIRFVRLQGEPADITLGRADGPPYRHIKLPVETVSRTHARLQYEDGRWRITNLSQTNPTVVNGHELDDASRSRWLDDGDRIQIGEMVFRFRAD